MIVWNMLVPLGTPSAAAARVGRELCGVTAGCEPLILEVTS